MSANQQYTGTREMLEAEIAAETQARVGGGGSATFSGTGSATTFNIPHGLGVIPSRMNVLPSSAAAAAPFYVTANSTNLVVTYLTAPAAASNNVVLTWSANP